VSRADPLREALKGVSSAVARGAEQPELFANPTDPAAIRAGEIEAARDRGLKGGRPKGAQNLATRELRAWLLQGMGGRTPQEQLAAWSNLGPEGLAAALGCSKLEAFDRWRGVLEYLGRFFAAPMAPTDGEGKPVPQFVVQIGGASGIVTASGEVAPPWAYIEQDQGLGDDASPQSKTEEP
jgi:hypothetical protein